MIKNQEKPHDDWPTFYVTVKGQARSYEEGMKKIATLETEAYAFSNTEVPPEKLTARIEQNKRQQQLQSEALSMMSHMQLAIDSSNIKDCNIETSTEGEYEQSDDERSNDFASKKRKSSKSQKFTKKSKTTDVHMHSNTPIKLLSYDQNPRILSDEFIKKSKTTVDMQSNNHIKLLSYDQKSQISSDKENKDINFSYSDIPDQVLTREEFYLFEKKK
ncbi:uncharacterized protein LOC130674338 [Microplitis mediator]|uniref:uncharacterized protein LOC130674338 n=1 Tax=Microplitis mediator TaxID=375433 RepID=UPI0025557486|nr:uncharacterized protein LOC130674338 [Microplitis mediator]